MSAIIAWTGACVGGGEPAAPFLRGAEGAIVLEVSGLPDGASASISVRGPGGVSRAVQGPATLTDLPPGTYIVGADTVVNNATTWMPLPDSQTVTVSEWSQTAAAISYAPAPPLNLTIDAVHITQVVQTYRGEVPLVAGRPGLLRVFVKASRSTAARPSVRVRLYRGQALVREITISPPPGPVPTVVNEGDLSASWNHAIDSAWLETGTSLLAEVDVEGTVAESAESDNVWPATGVPAALDVRTVRRHTMRFVPVLQSSTGLLGDITDSNLEYFLSGMRKMLPPPGIDADIRATYTTSAPPLEAKNGNLAWLQVLNEIHALRIADGDPRHYYGVVKTSYASGVAGVANLHGRAAIGWDAPASAPRILAHEAAHNFGRSHAPCGVVGIDPYFPYAGGVTGVYGYDPGAGILKPPTFGDLMGYCANAWISDYTYEGVLQWFEAYPYLVDASAQATAEPEPGVLVWGRIEGGEPVLEPAYDIDAPPFLPAQNGPNRLEGLGPAGEPLFTLAFAGERVSDGNDDDRTFAFVVPARMLRGVPLARIRLSAHGRTIERQSSSQPPAHTPAAARVDARTVHVTWPVDEIHGVLVRDGATGEILTFGRGGSARVHTTAPALELQISDGVRSTRRRIQPD